VTLATLETTAQALNTPAWQATLPKAGEAGGGACLRAARAIMANLKPSRRLGGEGHPEHDSCAVAWLVAPQLFTSRAVHASVDLGPGPSRGRTVIDRWGRFDQPRNARLLERLDADGFFRLLAERLPRLP
jgi:inosine-uridine nucleoside N-ribohydrolase